MAGYRTFKIYVCEGILLYKKRPTPREGGGLVG